MKHQLRSIWLACLLLACANSLLAAQDGAVESSVLTAAEGASGTALGAVVEEVKASEAGTMLLLSLPEEVSTDRKIILLTPEGNEVRQNKNAVIIESYNEGRTGIRLFVDKEGQFEFRLRLVDISDNPE